MGRKKLRALVARAVSEALEPVAAEVFAAVGAIRRKVAEQPRPIPGTGSDIQHWMNRTRIMEAQNDALRAENVWLKGEVGKLEDVKKEPRPAVGTPQGLRRIVSYLLDCWFQGRPYDGTAANDLRRRVGLYQVDDRGNPVSPVPRPENPVGTRLASAERDEVRAGVLDHGRDPDEKESGDA